MLLFVCVRGGESYERGRSPLSLLLPSPARKALKSCTMALAGEGFILKVHPEGFSLKGKG